MDSFQPNHLRILVADDEEAILAVYQKALSSEQHDQEIVTEMEALEGKLFGENVSRTATQAFDLVLCRQGEAAVAAVKRSLEEHQPFAVAFLDLRMPPGPDGVWAAEQIRALDPHIEIVMVTAYSDVDPRDIACRVLPADKLLYIQKPFHLQEITQFASALGSKWQAEYELRKIHADLERRVDKRTAELARANEQLEKDIAERKQMEKALRESEERHRIVLEAVPDPVVVYDMEGSVTYLNPAFSRVFGWTLSESRGRMIAFVPAEYLPEITLIFEKINCGETISGMETCRLTKDGTRVEVSLSGAGFFDRQDMLQGSVITLQDITERKKTEEEIHYLAYHDVLTGLPNRKSFYLYLEDEVGRSYRRPEFERRGRGHNWALLFLDLDKFKNVNDTLGHDIGDELLKVVAERLRNCVRNSDSVFRLSGDEFTIFLNDLARDTDVAKVAEKVRAAVARPYCLKGHELYMTVTIGISIYPVDGKDVKNLVKNADMAMYAAKEEHHGYRFFTEEMNRKALERMRLERNLRTALQDHQFVLYYQPLVEAKKRVVGMEALIRWHHPEFGLISPAKFIPIAEETGAIIPIGRWVLHTACQQARKWHDMGYAGLYVSVNLSSRQFQEPDLVEIVEQELETTGLSPQCLKLEVTESCIMENPEEAIAKMKLLRTKGVHFSIDDFGTGYSSLSYLKRFPIDILKIDRAFVMDAPTNSDDQEIIKTIIAMAHNLGLNTVAEGVETQEQQDFLIQQGCYMMQGYYFGKPLAADKFEIILRRKGLPARKGIQGKDSNTPARHHDKVS